MRLDTVSVTIVTYNSAGVIERCLDRVLAQTYGALEVVVVDNASKDATRHILAGYEGRVRVIYNRHNTGFAAGQNQAIRASRSDWVLTLNPDVFLLPDFVSQLVDAARIDGKIGTVCGRLLRIHSDGSDLHERRIDSAGIFFTSTTRHFDRGWNEPDDGRYRQTEYVFGACAAAALYRRKMIVDIEQPDGFFDPDFFSYREDADVAWRAQLLGWRCLYVHDAESYHVRRMLPGDRSSVPAVLNMHSVKNRYLMRVKNMTGDLYRRIWFPTTARDLLIVGGCLFYEPTSLSAFWHALKALRRTVRKRRAIMARRRVTDEYLASWFQQSATARPVPKTAVSEVYR
ncbi:glycosyltransferase family 2 protein [uncultured Paludibaculum sp.]|uniref:glycosyltransferase family 2 protein n=1 Tax=uncultured Paludibaculum sp. TaxID=1765020 RepID=UPI002AAACAC3|nr:glycosyltransferase family 2 protein [uncultured Paludibaculum sp.]